MQKLLTTFVIYTPHSTAYLYYTAINCMRQFYSGFSFNDALGRKERKKGT
jgi:hypothetical protein